MKVKTLIKRLQKLDPESPVFTEDECSYTKWRPLVAIRKGVVRVGISKRTGEPLYVAKATLLGYNKKL